MKYAIASHASRIHDPRVEQLGDRIRAKGHHVYYIFVDGMNFYDVLEDASKQLSYDDNVCVIVPKWGEIRRWPRLYSELGAIQIYSGVYGF